VLPWGRGCFESIHLSTQATPICLRPQPFRLLSTLCCAELWALLLSLLWWGAQKRRQGGVTRCQSYRHLHRTLVVEGRVLQASSPLLSLLSSALSLLPGAAVGLLRPLCCKRILLPVSQQSCAPCRLTYGSKAHSTGSRAGPLAPVLAWWLPLLAWHRGCLLDASQCLKPSSLPFS
jgi:hypothetical protein